MQSKKRHLLQGSRLEEGDPTEDEDFDGDDRGDGDSGGDGGSKEKEEDKRRPRVANSKVLKRAVLHVVPAATPSERQGPVSRNGGGSSISRSSARGRSDS